MIASRPEFQIEVLADHDRAAFSCGIEPLDRYLKQQASQDARKKVAVPLVLCTTEKRVIGYCTLSSTSLKGDDLRSDALDKLRLPRYAQLPATLIGRLAVDQSYHKQRLGEFLLLHALKRSWLGSLQIASLAVIVEAVNLAAREFYLRYDFLTFPENDRRLFLPMQTIEKLFSTAEREPKSSII